MRCRFFFMLSLHLIFGMPTRAQEEVETLSKTKVAPAAGSVDVTQQNGDARKASSLEPEDDGNAEPVDPAEKMTSSPAKKASWRQTFGVDALHPHIRLLRRNVGVVIVTEDESLRWETDTAVSAFVLVLEREGAGNTVLRLSSGELTDDKALLQWAFHEEDLDAFFIFRPIRVDDGAMPQAVVTAYSRRERLLAAFTATKGVALLPPVEQDSLGEVSERTSKSKRRTISNNDVNPPKKRRKIRDRRGFKKPHGSSRATAFGKIRISKPQITSENENSRFFQSRPNYYTSDGKPLAELELYEAIGRKDLADAYKARQVLSVTFYTLSLLTSVFSPFASLLALPLAVVDPALGFTLYVLINVGTLIMGAGFGFFGLYTAFNPAHTVETEAAVRAYNGESKLSSSGSSPGPLFYTENFWGGELNVE